MMVSFRMVVHAFVPPRQLSSSVIRLQSTSSSTANDSPQSLQHTTNDEDKNTTTTITWGDCTITLIGTAHLSASSNAQVKRVMAQVQPQAVMIELDAARLPRIGIPSIKSIQNITHILEADCTLPTLSTTSKQQHPFAFLQNALIKLSSLFTRQWLTKAYDTVGERMDAQGGGEFLVAIQAAQASPTCHTLVLGDRSSVTTIQRALLLALKSPKGGIWGVGKRLQHVNAQEMETLERTIREEWVAQSDGVEPTEGEVQVAMMERLKQDTTFRTRLFAQLERKVPEFTRAFVNERDYLMAECVRNMMVKDSTVSRIVGVVGLAHVAGMEKHLQAVMRNETPPLTVLMENEEKKK